MDQQDNAVPMDLETLMLDPIDKVIIGQVVDVTQSRGGIIIPGSDVKNVSCFLRVDQVGPGVKSCRTGDVIVYMKMNHIYLRNGVRWGVVQDEPGVVLCVVRGIHRNAEGQIDDPRLVISGERRVDGASVVPEDKRFVRPERSA